MPRCEDCHYFKEPTSKYGKGECTWYDNYCYPEDSSCGHFKDRDSSGGCYLTTACCEFKGLPDDCHELTVMRNFRDTYLKEQPYGNKLIEFYYLDAPSLVKLIDRQENRAEIYHDIYGQIQEIVKLVEIKENETAIILYMYMVHGLYRAFAPLIL